MRRFIIEREIPGVGNRHPEGYCADAQRSKNVLDAMGTNVQWIHSYVGPDKLFCVYLAENEGLIREHAERSGFPATRIHEIHTVIDPTTAAI
jgi:hypothetical protein